MRVGHRIGASGDCTRAAWNSGKAVRPLHSSGQGTAPERLVSPGEHERTASECNGHCMSLCDAIPTTRIDVRACAGTIQRWRGDPGFGMAAVDEPKGRGRPSKIVVRGRLSGSDAGCCAAAASSTRMPSAGLRCSRTGRSAVEWRSRDHSLLSDRPRAHRTQLSTGPAIGACVATVTSGNLDRSGA